MNANRIGVGLMMLLWPMAAAMADTVRATPKVTGSGAMRFGPYTYDGAGNIRTIGRDGGVQEVYQYDVLSRLTSATAEVTNTQSYTYDPFGNRVNAQRTNGSAECTGGSTCEQNAIPSRLTNHLPSPSTYDDAGNLTMGPGGGRYAYDAAGMMTRALTGAGERQFLYTADDERIATYEGSSSWTWTVRAGDGKVLREYTSTNDTATGNLGTKDRKWTTDYMWRDGQLLSTEKPGSGGTTERLDYHLDHLGTPRLITSGAGLKVSTHAYYAFGAELRVVGAAAESPETKMKFTGHERDLAGTSDMLDYMHARYYSSLQGRFLSVDPKLDVEKATKEPQWWNRYSYVANDPLRYTDPDGRDAVLIVISKGDAADEKAGHAALWVGDNQNGFGISVYGGHGFDKNTPTPEALIDAYRKEGREVRTYLLSTKPDEDAKMIAFMKADPNRAGVDDTKSIVRQNCSTAIANTLTAGGVIRTPRAVALEVSGTIYTPKGLERSTRGIYGALVDRLKAIRIFKPITKDKPIARTPQ